MSNFFLQYNSRVEKKFYSIILLVNISHLPWLINYFCCSESLLNRRRFRKCLGLSLHNCSSPDLCQSSLTASQLQPWQLQLKHNLIFLLVPHNFLKQIDFRMDWITSEHKAQLDVNKYMQCCCEEEGDDLFSVTPAHRTSIRLEMHLRTIPLVIRLNSFRLINSQRKVDSLYMWRLKSSLDKHLSGLVWAGDILLTCRGSLQSYFPWRLSAPTLTISTALKENVPTKVRAVQWRNRKANPLWDLTPTQLLFSDRHRASHTQKLGRTWILFLVVSV